MQPFRGSAHRRAGQMVEQNENDRGSHTSPVRGRTHRGDGGLAALGSLERHEEIRRLSGRPWPRCFAMFATMCLSFSAARPLESSLLLLPELVIESTARRGASTLFLLTRAAATPLGNHEAGVESHVARQKLRQAVVQRRIDGRRLSFLLLLFFLVLSASVLRGALLQSQVDHPQHLVP